MTIFLSKPVKLTLEVFLGYSYEMAYFHPDILIEAILIKKSVYIVSMGLLFDPKKSQGWKILNQF